MSLESTSCECTTIIQICANTCCADEIGDFCLWYQDAGQCSTCLTLLKGSNQERQENLYNGIPDNKTWYDVEVFDVIAWVSAFLLLCLIVYIALRRCGIISNYKQIENGKSMMTTSTSNTNDIEQQDYNTFDDIP